MRAVVFAYHTFGVIGLEALAAHGYEVAALFTHEDDPNEEVWFKSPAAWAKEHGVPTFTPDDVNRAEEVERIRALAPEIMFSFYYRHMISPAILAIPAQGALNLHGSLLPHYRGRAPVNWAILKGEQQTGVTLHYMVEKPDAGEIVAQRAVPIAFEDTARAVYAKLEGAARELLDDALPKIKTGTHDRLPNRIEDGSYFGGRRPQDGHIDWSGPAERIYNLIRAVTHPYPGAFGELDGEQLLLWWAEPSLGLDGLAPGVIAIQDGHAYVGSGVGALLLSEVEYRGRVFEGAELLELMKKHEGKTLR